MRKAAVSLVIVFLVGNSPLPVVEAAVNFPDTNDSWYQEAIYELKNRGVIKGYPDGTFRPRQEVNRAEFLKMVMKGRGGLDPVKQSCFSDVDLNEWYAPFVCAAERRGIVEGYPDGSFRPGKTVNFAEALKIILVAYERETLPNNSDDWFEPYVNFLDENNVLSRYSYLPATLVNRERMADIVYRVLKFEDLHEVSNLSPGCNKPFPQKPPFSVNVDGVNREFLLTIPDDYITSEEHPLIIAFHGRTNPNHMVRGYYDFDKYADEFFIAYPAGMSNGNGSFNWADSGDKAYEIRDIELFDKVVRAIGNAYCIDMHRIFVAGHSLGAWISNSLACVRGDVIRGSGTVGGSSVITNCAGPSAAWIAHNPNDRLASFAASEVVRELRAESNTCGNATNPVAPQSLNCEQFLHCQDGNPVHFCPHNEDLDWRGEYYPHTWPSDAGKEITEFFRKLP